MVCNVGQSAEVLQLPERQETALQHVIAAVQHWLSVHSQWLLIWENVEDLELLRRFLPAVQSDALLLTTRNPVLGTLAWGIPLPPMERVEGMLFLLRRAKVLEEDAPLASLQQLGRACPVSREQPSDL